MPQRAISSRHCTIHLRHEYDPCISKITLHWNGYEGWSLNPNNINGLVSYHVMRIPGGEVEVCQPGQKSYSHIVNNVEDRDIYTYYIEAKRRDGETSTSYKTEQITNMPLNVETSDALIVSAYPNPTNGAVTLEFATHSTNFVNINDMTGKLLVRQMFSDQIVLLDFNGYPVGVYLLVIDDGKRQTTMKIIKK